ncbi:MAG: heme exporter protein CcmB [Pseudomonadota bacterium]
MIGLLWLELKGALARPVEILNPIAFLVLAVMLFAVVLPAASLAQFGGSILWVLVLLTTLLALDSLFRKSFDDGTLEQLLVHAQVPFLVVLLRLFVHWLLSGLLLTLLSPLLGLSLQLPPDALWSLFLAMLAGTPALTLLGGMGAALTVGFSRGGVLLALLVLPLFIPVLIFGASAVQESLIGASVSAQLYWLTFVSALALLVGPFATLAGLKISIQMQG